jgi:hypothetical protein
MNPCESQIRPSIHQQNKRKISKSSLTYPLTHNVQPFIVRFIIGIGVPIPRSHRQPRTGMIVFTPWRLSIFCRRCLLASITFLQSSSLRSNLVSFDVCSCICIWRSIPYKLVISFFFLPWRCPESGMGPDQSLIE